MQIAHYSHLSVRRYTYPYTIFNGLSGKAVAKRPRARFSCCTMTTNLGETFRLALAALRSTVGDAKFREIEKTWVQEHQEQFDPTGLKITATYSDKSTKAIDAAERRVQPAVQDRRQHGSDHRPGGTRTADGRRQRGHRMAVRRLGAVLLRAVLRGAMVQITVRPPLDAANDRVFGGLVRGRTAIRHHASGRAAVGAFVRRTLAGLSFLAAWLRRERSLWGNDGRNR